jgi:hypothetical protein
MPTDDDVRVIAWLSIGQREGWIGDVFCESHDTSLTDDELAYGNCAWCVRIHALDGKDMSQ